MTPIELTGLQRLQLVRSELADENLKKTGKGNHEIKYWQLADFVPFITKLCVKHDLFPAFSMLSNAERELIKDGEVYAKETISQGFAQLIMFDSISGKQIVDFTCPLADASLPKAQQIINRGAEITYFRRYMYMIALDITEPDMVDSAKSILVNSLKQVDYDNLHNATSINTLNTVATALQQTYPKAIVAIEYDIAKKKLLKEKDSKTAFKPKGGVNPDEYKSSLL